MNARAMIHQLDIWHEVEISADVYLVSSSDMVSDQKTWDDEDEAKEIDFTEYPYWITVSGRTPEGIKDDADLEIWLSRNL